MTTKSLDDLTLGKMTAWVDKKHFAVTKILGKLSFFDGDFGTDKEFMENKQINWIFYLPGGES